MESLTYIDEIAVAIAEDTKAHWSDLEENERALYRIYAVLALSVGEWTSNKNVHDAWSAWRVATKPDHKSLVPFEKLTPAVQKLDTEYRDAIRRASWRFKTGM